MTNVRVVGSIHIEVPVKPVCPNDPTGKKVSAIAGKRRIDIPSQTSQHGSGWRLLRRDHLLDYFWREDGAAIKQCLGKLGEIVGS